MRILVKSVSCALFLLVATVAPTLWAQDNAAYVSRLSATPGTSSVMLTWKDAQGFSGVTYEIWRSDKEILKDTLPQAKLLGTVNTGVEAFEDRTVTGPSFYLVLLRDASGNRKGYFVPFRNKTTTAVKPDGTVPSSAAKVKVGEVLYSDPTLLIPFQAFPQDRKLSVYRRLSPITSPADLRDSTLVGTTTGAQSPFRDTPAPGLEFYYAVVDAQALADGRPDVFQKESTTVQPAGFPLVALPENLKDSAIDEKLRPNLGESPRALPLPMLQVGSEPDSGNRLVDPGYEPIQPVPLDPQTEKSLKLWSKSTAAPGEALPAPVILPEERSGTQTGTGKYLVQIQTAYLGPGNWTGAVKALETLVQWDLEPRTMARARFYLGEAKANEGRFKDAFMEFLGSRDIYPDETRPFLEAMFSLLSTEKE